MPDQLPKISQQEVVRLWLSQQGLLDCSRPRTLTAATFVEELERLGGLQVDSVNVLDRAHYLTLWSRFGNYDRARVDSWLYQDRLAYEYWGHEASILPISHLPLGKRRMKRFTQLLGECRVLVEVQDQPRVKAAGPQADSSKWLSRECRFRADGKGQSRSFSAWLGGGHPQGRQTQLGAAVACWKTCDRLTLEISKAI